MNFKEMSVLYNIDKVAVISKAYNLTLKEQLVLGLIYSFKDNKRAFKIKNETIVIRLFGKEPTLSRTNDISFIFTKLQKKNVIKCVYERESKVKNNRTDVVITIPDSEIEELMAKHIAMIQKFEKKNQGIESKDTVEQIDDFKQNEQTNLLDETHVIEPIIEETIEESAYYDELADAHEVHLLSENSNAIVDSTFLSEELKKIYIRFHSSKMTRAEANIEVENLENQYNIKLPEDEKIKIYNSAKF